MPQSASLEDLPPELTANILRYISDFESLYNVLHASTSAWRCFTFRGAEITERVLDADPMHFHIRDVIRTVAYVREAKLPLSSLGDFQDRIACDPVKHGVVLEGEESPEDMFIPQAFPEHGVVIEGEQGEEGSTKDIFSPQAFPEHVSTGTLRGILATHRWITFHTLQCLDFYKDRLHRLQPQKPTDAKFNIGRRSLLALRQANLQTAVVRPPDPEPAWTWTEEQLVIRAFWRTQLVLDLRKALRDGLITDWPDVDVQQLNPMSTPDVYQMSGPLREYIAMALWDVDSSRGYRGRSELTEHSLVLNVADYLSKRSHLDLPRTWSRPRQAPLPDQNDRQAMLEHWNVGLNHFEYLFTKDNMHKVMHFDFFRNHGFAIWSKDRLRQHGFGALIADTTLGAGFAAWISVLPEEQLRKLAQWEEHVNAARRIR